MVGEKLNEREKFIVATILQLLISIVVLPLPLPVFTAVIFTSAVILGLVLNYWVD